MFETNLSTQMSYDWSQCWLTQLISRLVLIDLVGWLPVRLVNDSCRIDSWFVNHCVLRRITSESIPFMPDDSVNHELNHWPCENREKNRDSQHCRKLFFYEENEIFHHFMVNRISSIKKAMNLYKLTHFQISRHVNAYKTQSMLVNTKIVLKIK